MLRTGNYEDVRTRIERLFGPPALAVAIASLAACGGSGSTGRQETAVGQNPNCAQYRLETQAQQSVYMSHVYPGMVKVLRSEMFAMDDKVNVKNLKAAPAHPSASMIRRLAADAAAACRLPKEYPDIQVANAYLTGRLTFPAG